MRKLLIIFAVLYLALPVVAQEKKNNPGYFETPGFIALGGSAVRNRGALERDQTVAPYLFGVYNLIQSEYGNLGILGGVEYTRPRQEYTGSVPFEVKSDLITTDIGIGYFTAAKTVNFFIGAGYSFGWFNMKLQADNSYSTSYSETTHGFFYFAGAEYMLTEDGKWGLFFMFNAREMESTDFDYDDGAGFSGSKFTNVSNQVYSFGLTYHF